MGRRKKQIVTADQAASTSSTTETSTTTAVTARALKDVITPKVKATARIGVQMNSEDFERARRQYTLRHSNLIYILSRLREEREGIHHAGDTLILNDLNVGLHGGRPQWHLSTSATECTRPIRRGRRWYSSRCPRGNIGAPGDQDLRDTVMALSDSPAAIERQTTHILYSTAASLHTTTPSVVGRESEHGTFAEPRKTGQADSVEGQCRDVVAHSAYGTVTDATAAIPVENIEQIGSETGATNNALGDDGIGAGQRTRERRISTHVDTESSDGQPCLKAAHMTSCLSALDLFLTLHLHPSREDHAICTFDATSIAPHDMHLVNNYAAGLHYYRGSALWHTIRHVRYDLHIVSNRDALSHAITDLMRLYPHRQTYRALLLHTVDHIGILCIRLRHILQPVLHNMDLTWYDPKRTQITTTILPTEQRVFSDAEGERSVTHVQLLDTILETFQGALPGVMSLYVFRSKSDELQARPFLSL